MKPFFAMLGLICFFLISGCSSNAKLYPVKGTITKNSMPIDSGGLIFIPEKWTGDLVNASIEKNGHFTLTTSRSGETTIILPGAPAGIYRIIYNPPDAGQKVGLEIELPNTVEIKQSDNVLKLDIPIDAKTQSQKTIESIEQKNKQ